MSSSNKQKALLKVLNKFLTQSVTSKPSVSSDSLGSFFVEKIETLRSSIISSDSIVVAPPTNPLQLSTFSPTSSDEVSEIIHHSNKSFSPADPFPSKYITSILNTLVPFLVKLFNLSLELGCVPQQFKHAFVTPLLKKSSLDPCEPSSYRPISLLPFFSKVLERIVCSRLLTHMSSFLDYETFQSGFKIKHSTESALLYVTNELRNSEDLSNVSMLILLNLSAVFDTLDHSILIDRLRSFIGLSG